MKETDSSTKRYVMFNKSKENEKKCYFEKDILTTWVWEYRCRKRNPPTVSYRVPTVGKTMETGKERIRYVFQVIRTKELNNNWKRKQ